MTAICKLFNCLTYPRANRAGSKLEYPFLSIAIVLLLGSMENLTDKSELVKKGTQRCLMQTVLCSGTVSCFWMALHSLDPWLRTKIHFTQVSQEPADRGDLQVLNLVCPSGLELNSLTSCCQFSDSHSSLPAFSLFFPKPCALVL